VDDDGEVIAIIDWDHAALAPREHDLWMLLDEERSNGLLTAYGERDLDATHLEYALLARALRDLAARVHNEVDRPGIEQWGFRRLAHSTRYSTRSADLMQTRALRVTCRRCRLIGASVTP
jgi:aminoglycoside phosphotransferase (APT) family kinase protein